MTSVSMAVSKQKRWTVGRTLTIAISLLIGFGVPAYLFTSYFRIGVDWQAVKCLPHTVWLMRSEPHSNVVRGQYVQYVAKNIAPIADGSIVVKIAAGVPGDHVHVDADGVVINGVYWGPVNPEILRKMGLSEADITRDLEIPKGKLFVLGTLPRAWDGRYWGLLDERQVIGRAWPIW